VNPTAIPEAVFAAVAQPQHISHQDASAHGLHADGETTATGIREQFVRAMRVAVTGVNVVTTNGLAGEFGLTISAMCSVSADPALLLVCLNRKSPLGDALLINRQFCINVLSTQQHHVAKIFSDHAGPTNAYNFGEAEWERNPSDVARLTGAIATFDCVLEDTHLAGTHRIFIGRVINASANTGTPLLYTDRSYGFPLKRE